MDFNPQQQHILLSKMGYTGPANPKMMDAFLSSNPGAAARMGKFSRAAQKMNAGNMGMAQGGTVAKPSMKELMDATGVDAKTASEMLYGVVGSNAESRDWGAIMASSDPVTAAKVATFNMYKPTIAEVQENGKTMYQIQTKDGNPLRTFNTLEQAQAQGGSFGIGVSAPAPTPVTQPVTPTTTAATPAATPAATTTAKTTGTANKAPAPTAFTVKTSGGKMDERTYTVVDSAGKVVFGPTPNKGAADADAKSRNAATTTTTPPTTGTPTNPAPNTSSDFSDFDEKGLLKSGATVTLVEENGKFYLKDSQGRFLSNQTITGGSGNRYVFADAAAAQKYMDTKGFRSPIPVPDVGITNPDTTTPPADGITTVPALSPGRGLIQDTIRDPFTYVSTPTVSTTSPTTDSTTIAEGTGQVTGDVSATTTGVDTTAQVVAPTAITPEAVTAVTSADAVAASTAGIKPAQGAIKEGSTITAQQQTQTSIADVEAAQGTGILMSNPVQRQIEAGEMVSGTAVDAAKVDKMMSQVQAAEATPTDKATVQGQLSELMTQFEGGKTPAWAAGAMRSAQAMLAERGLGASSMAGQAVIQAAMEAALPIAQIDAQTRAQFESQNLSNRQQTAMFAAQQRASFLQQEFDQNFQTRVLNAAKVSDIANLNFTAAQTIALENSRIINTVNLENLNNRQAMVLAKASALANLDIANLNNRQQAAVQNAQNFLQVDLTNLDNAQQAEMFRAQSNVQAILTDTAAENAIIQFNAASKNQADQFFADLTARALQFNADQQNAMNQFNTGEANATARFNAQQKAARDQFNATNSLVIAQANAKWRQDVATEATRAQNEANLQAAAAANAMTAKAMEQTWQQENDVIAYAFTAIENDKDRALQITLADKEVDLAKWTAGQAESAAMTEAIVNLVFGGFGS